MKSTCLVLLAVPMLAAAEPQQLPKKCSADSPVDDPCEHYGGTYLVSITPEQGDKCVVKKPAKARVKVDKTVTYRGLEKSPELAALARALGMPRADFRIGADIRDGVCCLDFDISDASRTVRVKIARGKRMVNSKGRDKAVKGSSDCQGDPQVTVELVE